MQFRPVQDADEFDSLMRLSVDRSNLDDFLAAAADLESRTRFERRQQLSGPVAFLHYWQTLTAVDSATRMFTTIPSLKHLILRLAPEVSTQREDVCLTADRANGLTVARITDWAQIFAMLSKHKML